MSWISLLYETYENCASEIGKMAPMAEEAERAPAVPLLPIAHTTQEAQLDVTVDMQGNLLTAHAIENKGRRRTIIPCTEKSAGRTSGEAPHPLFDKLQYVAGDYARLGGPKAPYFASYIAQLGAWCDSAYAHPMVCAVYAYLQKGTLMADLAKKGLFVLDEAGRVDLKPDVPDKPPLYQAVTGDVTEAFVRFSVAYSVDEPANRLYEDPEVRECFIAWYLSGQQDEALCYVQGSVMPTANNNPNKIRNTADKAKLISFNDTSGFTFRGRFESAEQAVRVGYETTQKAHNALKWLIDRQGYRNGSQAYVAWGTRNEKVPAFMNNSLDANLGFSPMPVETQKAFADNLRTQMRGAGYEALDREARVAIMGLDNATPGRLAITYYRQMNGAELLDRLLYWYATCAWEHGYYRAPAKTANEKPVYLRGVFTPAPRDIVKAAYGENVPDKVMRASERQLVPCILECAPVPMSLVKNLFYRATRPISMDAWEYYKTFSIACAVVRKSLNDQYNRQHGNLRLDDYEEVWKMALDLDNRDRSYLFGRVWAYFNYLELIALRKAERNTTNAMKLEERFTQRPADTAMTLRAKLGPYLQRMDMNNGNLMQQLFDVLSILDSEGGFTNDPVGYPFLLGMASQMDQFSKDSAERKALAEKEAQEKAEAAQQNEQPEQAEEENK
nr:type I-C CRISPR-associated protein Cas8c/Csd1 [Maliibacterium massiliense]